MLCSALYVAMLFKPNEMLYATMCRRKGNTPAPLHGLLLLLTRSFVALHCIQPAYAPCGNDTIVIYRL